MAFKRPTEGETIRADRWDAGAHVVLRPFVSEALDTAMQQAAIKPPLGMSREEFLDGGFALQLASADIRAARNVLLSGMVLSHTLRYEPTAGQASAGEPGDLIPVEDWWDCLPPDDYKVVEDAIGARRGGVVPAKGADAADDATFHDAAGADGAGLPGDQPLPA